MAFYIALFLVHCLAVLASLVPAALVVMAMVAGHVTLASIASVVAVLILAIPMTPFSEVLEGSVAA